jgi:hypothetical protein
LYHDNRDKRIHGHAAGAGDRNDAWGVGAHILAAVATRGVVVVVAVAPIDKLVEEVVVEGVPCCDCEN